MGERLEIKDFDILGLITLKDVKDIEKYVTPIKRNGEENPVEYLSRSKEYYNVKTMTELSESREELKKLLDRRITKRNFVILENMLNCSGKVYFKKMENYILDKKDANKKIEMDMARKCLEEDVKNIIVCLSKKGLISVDPSFVLPTGEMNSEKRLIEMDNKAMLYAFCKALDLGENTREKEVLTPGYGSLYIGPFMKAMYGCNYTNLIKSKYIKDTKPANSEMGLIDLISSDRIFKERKKIVLLDDNIGTGQTMEEIKEELNQLGILNEDIESGAIQYNWINYYRITVGDKKNDKKGNKIKRFNIEDYNILSPLNYYGHNLCDSAIDMLHSSGVEYINYLESKSYRIPGYNDLIGSIERGFQYAEMSGVMLSPNYSYIQRKQREIKQPIEEYKDKKEKPTISAQANINNIIKTIIEFSEDTKTIKERTN